MILKNFLIWISTILALAACASPKTIPAGPAATATFDATEAEVGHFVENFGSQLQTVSLLAPDAAEELNAKYAPYVSPSLLGEWQKNLSEAPGRTISSPWPDRIEVLKVTRQSPTRYMVTGQIIEITSNEVANGGAFDKIPVSITVEEIQGALLITGYQQ